MPQRLRIVRNKQTDQIQESRVRAGHWPELRFVAIPGWCESADRALSPRPCHDIGGGLCVSVILWRHSLKMTKSQLIHQFQ